MIFMSVSDSSLVTKYIQTNPVYELSDQLQSWFLEFLQLHMCM